MTIVRISGVPVAEAVALYRGLAQNSFECSEGAGEGQWGKVEIILDSPLPDGILDAFYGASAHARRKTR